MGDKGLDQVPTGSFESFRTAEIRGVRFNKSWIEVVLADHEAQPVPQPRLTVVRTILGIRLCSLLRILLRTGGTGNKLQIFYRAKPDPVSLTKGSGDGSRFGNAHFSSVDQGRNIGGISIAISNETLRPRRVINSSSKNPVFHFGITKFRQPIHPY